MPHYIRFLKSPKIEKERSIPNSSPQVSIKTLITITTDLGDAFLAEDVELAATIILLDSCVKQQNFLWQPGFRQLAISMTAGTDLTKHTIQLKIGPAGEGQDSDCVGSGSVPSIISAWSPPFGGPSLLPAEKLVLRRFKTHFIPDLQIWEDTGNSIARHIWDVSLACLMLFQDVLDKSSKNQNLATASFRDLFLRRSETTRFRVIELGAGCGIVGIALAQWMANCTVILTDLEEVREIIDRNVERAEPTAGSDIHFRVLDWDQSIPDEEPIRQRFDMIVMSDCTYNPDSLPALVGTMAALVDQSPDASIIVGIKRRHDSEDIFFDLMRDANLGMHGKLAVPLLSSGASHETVNIEIYCFRQLRSAT
ncbi:hypothetical protein FQN57_003492 [Myotisia sp. PD_48]|nr:hypothetical protein FQN57_003492 [Myotisia sp. PD_48]